MSLEDKGGAFARSKADSDLGQDSHSEKKIIKLVVFWVVLGFFFAN